MKIEVNIDKRYFLAILGIILIGMGVYAAVDTSQPYHSASQVELSDGDSLQEKMDKMGELEAVKCEANITARDYSGDHEGCTVTVSCTNDQSKLYSWRNTGEWNDNKCWDNFDGVFTTAGAVPELKTTDASYIDAGRKGTTREYYMLKLTK